MQHSIESSPRDPSAPHAHPRRGAIGAVVEVAPDPADALPAELLASAYRASRDALVVLVCPASARAEIDAALGPAVEEVGVDVCGVLYLDGEDEAGIRRAVQSARLVAASSEPFRERLRAWGVPFTDPGDAARLLCSWAAEGGVTR